MEPISNQYALAALKERRATIAGEISSIEDRLRYLRKMAEAVDHTIRLFDSNIDPGTIPPKKPYKRVKLFKGGELNRLILNALRKAGKPITTGEVTDLVIAELGHGPDAKRGMANRVRANLCYLHRERGLVTKEGDRADAKWSLAS